MTRLNFQVALATVFCALASRGVLAASPADRQPPIPVRFSLTEPGFATAVIEDATGHRVRNLIGDTYLAAGDHVVYWDGLDESGVVHGTPQFTYKVVGKLVSPGKYQVRGLVHKAINLRYQMTVNCPGNPPWENEARSGAWLADHSPQTSCLFLPGGSPYGKQPQMLLGSSVAEGGSSLAWVDLQGHKLYGSKAAGWQGAHALASDPGKDASPDVSAYTLFYDNQVQVFALTNDGKTAQVFAHQAAPLPGAASAPAYTRADTNHLGLAVYNATCVASLAAENQLLFIGPPDKPGARGKQIATVNMPSPAGLLADAAGKLYVVTGREVHKFDVDWAAGKLSNDKTVIGAGAGLEDPHKLAMDSRGNLYVSDWGSSNQVKLFSPDGRFLRAVGKAGPLQVGPYDPSGMTQPNGLALDSSGRLWVAECSYLPKRCSVWTADGKLAMDFIGPSPYAGGGILDSRDRTRLIFAPHSGCLEFKLDWDSGKSALKTVLFRPETGRLEMLDKDGTRQVPHLPIYAGERRYLSNIYNENDGPGAAGIWQERDGKAILVAAVGFIRNWSMVDQLVMKDDWLKTHLPAGVALNPITIAGKVIPLFTRTLPDGRKERVNLLFAWSDRNNDEKVDLDELTFTWAPHPAGAWVVGDGLAVTDNQGDQLSPSGFTDAGVPLFDATTTKRLLKAKLEIGAAEIRQPVPGKDGWLVVTGGPIEGFHNGDRMWLYHSPWSTGMSKGLSPKPQFPGQLLNTISLLGPPVSPRGSDAGEIWTINGDYGDLFMLTTDGLFVTTLFKDSRTAASPYWPEPATKGMLLNDSTLLAECYYPTITQTTDGSIYLQAGKNRSSIVQVEGLESIHRLPARELVVTEEMLKQAKAYFVAQEQQRPRAAEADTMTVRVRAQAPLVDGKLDDWAGASWATIDEQTRAALAIAGDRLYAAFSTDYDLPLSNNPDSLQTLFKGGDALDIMLGTDANADPKRTKPVPGDLRLTVSRIKGKVAAILSRAVVPNAAAPVKYESPIGSTTIDQVTDVSAEVQLASGSHQENARFGKKTVTDYELSIPLATLGLTPGQMKTLTGDIGILRGKPGLTADRIYWHNKATGQTADLPTEAALTPGLWGKLQFKAGEEK